MTAATQMQTPSKPIHPFPARMAPEIGQAAICSLSEDSIVLDPMAGSGSTLRKASEAGHHAVGIDSDPLAVSISRAWTNPIGDVPLAETAAEMIANAKRLKPEEIRLPWIDEDEETREFISYWFADEQKSDLRRLAYLLSRDEKWASVHLRVALSRIVITKEKGASLARDVSHSRPHRVKLDNEYDVFSGFVEAAKFIDSNLRAGRLKGRVDVYEGDARKLSGIETGSIDLIVTSPPYLNAIDYLRGHRLSLVWLGYSVSSIRRIRGDSIGSERMATSRAGWNAALAGFRDEHSLSKLQRRQRYILMRYVQDLSSMFSEAHRVLKPNGNLVVVVGSATLKGVQILIPNIVHHILNREGFSDIESQERDLPERSRYLPPPSSVEGTDLSKRIRSEMVFQACKSM